MATTAAEVTVPEVRRIRRFSARNCSTRAAEASTSPTLAPAWINRRLKLGKEDPLRVSERRGMSADVRPAGPLVWIHGASGTIADDSFR